MPDASPPAIPGRAWPTALAAALGMAVPVALGLAFDRPAAGLAAALGALVAGGGSLAAVVPGLAGAGLGAVVAGHAWIRIALVGAAAALGGLSRPLAIATTRFALALWIVSALPPQPPARAAVLLALVALGAAWATLVGRALARTPAEPAPASTAAQRYRRWRRQLATFAGWSYPLRLTAALAAAQLAAARWPDHHLHWIGLTIVIVTPRQPARVPALLVHRALGTALGVVLAAALWLGPALPPWALVPAIAGLAAARPILRPRSYLGYAAVMTPLVVLLIDGGRPPSPGLLIDRLVATLAGAALVVVIGAVAARSLRRVDQVGAR